MKDRFTVAMLVIVAFVGGLLAMVVIARWQPGKPKAPAAGASGVAQVEAPAGREETGRPVSPGPVEGIQADTARPESRPPTEGGESRTIERTPDAAGRSGREQAPERRTVDRSAGSVGATGGGQRASGQETERGSGAPDRRPSKGPSSQPPAASGTATALNPERFGGKKSSAGALPPDQSFLIDVPNEGGRSAGGRQPDGSSRSPGENASGGTVGQPDTQDPAPAPPIESDPMTDPDPAGNDPDPRDDWTPPDDPVDEPDVEPEAELPPPPALVQARPSAAAYNVDDVVPILVQIQSATDVGHVPFHLAYDSHVLRFDSATEGDFLSIDGAATVFFATISGNGDAVVVGLSRLGTGPGIDGSGLLCVLNFVAVGPGTAQLRFQSASVKNSGNARMDAAFNADPVTVVAVP